MKIIFWALVLAVIVLVVPLGSAADATFHKGPFYIRVHDWTICPSTNQNGMDKGITSDGIGFEKYWTTIQSRPIGNRSATMWVTVYDKEIPANKEKTMELAKNYLNNDSGDRDINISERIVDGYDAIVANAKNSTGKEILATFWLDESHGYAKARFNLVSNSEEAIKRALDSLHVEKAELQPVRKPSRDL